MPTWSGFVYVAFAIDLDSRAIVGWQASTVKDTAFVEACLRMALWRQDHTGRPVLLGMIHHSDAGSQYTSIRFTENVAREGPAASIGSVGDAYVGCGNSDGPLQKLSGREGITVLVQPAEDDRGCRSDHLRLGRLVQQRTASRLPRQHPTRRIRAELLRSKHRPINR